MARDVTDEDPVTSKAQLVAWLEAGCKPPSSFRVGTEHEKFCFYKADLAPVPYVGAAGRGGVRDLLEGLRASGACWEPIEDRGVLIGLYDAQGGSAISLEPGGQFELSGAPLSSVHETERELRAHLSSVAAVAAPLGIGFLGLGMTPLWTRNDVPRMPKSRYEIMMNYMPKVGRFGLDMMLRTCTVQANLDFSEEADMVKKLRTSIALQPAATALFANSPFTEGRPNGLLSMRSEIWRDTDTARTGMLAFAFEDGMGFERYVDYALDVPMYFVKRGARYHDVAGASFRDLLAGRAAQLPGERATIADWANHLSTIFPEVRLKRFLEMRGADCGSEEHILALSALFVGLLYDQDALDAAWDLVKGASDEDRQRARDEAPRLGLAARFGARSMRDLAREILAIAREGLRRRARRDESGQDEGRFLDILDARVESGRTQAEAWLARFHDRWRNSVAPIFEEAAL